MVDGRRRYTTGASLRLSTSTSRLRLQALRRSRRNGRLGGGFQRPSGELFQDATYKINRDSRVRAAHLAKEASAQCYILPSSCSICGFLENGVFADETSPTNPLTTYARANDMAEQGVLPLADESFCARPRSMASRLVCASTRLRWLQGELSSACDSLTEYKPGPVLESHDEVPRALLVPQFTGVSG